MEISLYLFINLFKKLIKTIDYQLFFYYNLVNNRGGYEMKNFMKRKRLNNKGFTLIELLAVVVILAIVMGISATSVLNSINNSRSSSLHSTAQTAANTLNTWISEDMLVTSNKSKKLGDDFIAETQGETKADTWICLSGLKIQNADKTAETASTELWKALSLNEKDVDLTGNSLPTFDKENSKYSIVIDSNDAYTCSALRYNSSTGGYEVLLVARNGGKYFVSSEKDANYAFSRAEGPGVSITD